MYGYSYISAAACESLACVQAEYRLARTLQQHAQVTLSFEHYNTITSLIVYVRYNNVNEGGAAS